MRPNRRTDVVSKTVCFLHVFDVSISNRLHCSINRLTGRKVFPHVEARYDTVRDIEVGIHFQFGYLIRQLEKQLGIHCRDDKKRQ